VAAFSTYVNDVLSEISVAEQSPTYKEDVDQIISFLANLDQEGKELSTTGSHLHPKSMRQLKQNVMQQSLFQHLIARRRGLHLES